MPDGVKQSAFFVLFLRYSLATHRFLQCLTLLRLNPNRAGSNGVMSRKFVHLEVREAIRSKRPILLLHETDERHGKVDFGQERDRAPDDLKHLFDDIESIAWRRRSFERQAMLTELLVRAGPEYKNHFLEKEQAAARFPRRRDTCSAITPQAMWFNNFFYFRLALAVNTTIACLQNGRIVVCTGSGEEYTACFTKG
jgi:hypothetical protein